MSVGELLRTKPRGVVVVAPNADVTAAARLLMEHGIGGLPVVDADGVLVGFVSERAVVGALDRHARKVHELRISSVMLSPAPTCRADDRIQDVMRRMTGERLRHLVVVDDDGITGVISVGDLVKHRLEQLELEAGVLRDYVAAQRARG